MFDEIRLVDKSEEPIIAQDYRRCLEDLPDPVPENSTSNK